MRVVLVIVNNEEQLLQSLNRCPKKRNGLYVSTNGPSLTHVPAKLNKWAACGREQLPGFISFISIQNMFIKCSLFSPRIPICIYLIQRRSLTNHTCPANLEKRWENITQPTVVQLMLMLVCRFFLCVVSDKTG